MVEATVTVSEAPELALLPVRQVVPCPLHCGVGGVPPVAVAESSQQRPTAPGALSTSARGSNSAEDGSEKDGGASCVYTAEATCEDAPDAEQETALCTMHACMHAHARECRCTCGSFGDGKEA